MVFGTVSKIYNLAIPFVMRTLLIYTLGMAYTGLNSLFTSILSVLNLAELGVGAAMTFSMYKPIAEDDTATVCALMRLYKIYYRVIGLVILVAGTAITPALPFFIKKDVPADINIYILYAINLLTTVLSYWLFAYKNCILYAHQRNDIGDKIGLVINTVKYGLQAVVLVAFKNYYAYIIVALLLGVVSNLVTAIVADRLYPQYKAKGKLPKEQLALVEFGLRAHKYTFELIKAGVEASSIAKKYTQWGCDQGWGDYMLYGPVHGLGIMETESPWIETTSKYKLQENMTYQIDTFFTGNGYGLRWERGCIVTKDGCELMSRKFMSMDCCKLD